MTSEVLSIIVTIIVELVVFTAGFSFGYMREKRKEKISKAVLSVNHNDPKKDLFQLRLDTDLNEIEEDGYLLAMVVEE